MCMCAGSDCQIINRCFERERDEKKDEEMRSCEGDHRYARGEEIQQLITNMSVLLHLDRSWALRRPAARGRCVGRIIRNNQNSLKHIEPNLQ